MTEHVRQTRLPERLRYSLGGWLLRPYLDREREHYETFARNGRSDADAAYYDGVAEGLGLAAHPNRTWTHKEGP